MLWCLKWRRLAIALHDLVILFTSDLVSVSICSIEDAKRLIDLVQGIPCKINLISFNPHTGSQFRPTSEPKMIEFRNVLAEAGCTVFLRLSRGDDQMAACGQLGKPGTIQAPLIRVPEQFQMAVNMSVWIFFRQAGTSCAKQLFCLFLRERWNRSVEMRILGGVHSWESFIYLFWSVLLNCLLIF